MLLMLLFLAFCSSGWAEKKSKQQRDRQGWDDQWDKGDGDHPPGWDKGKKTGWQGGDLPPGQEKKYYRSYKHKHKHKSKHKGDEDWRRDDHGPEVTPVPVPVPVPR
jgi:hypothetical protein